MVKPIRLTRAFTLIELLIVVAIIGILAAIAVPNFMNAQIRARVAATESNMHSIGTALEMYMVDQGRYPNTYWPDTTTFINPRMWRFRRLTTPVAYLNSSIRDVFNTEDEPQNAVYPFWGPDTMDHRRLGTWFNHPSMQQIKNQRGGWAIMSYGTNKVFESTARQYLIPYDMSNGLISDGDIYRFGP